MVTFADTLFLTQITQGGCTMKRASIMFSCTISAFALYAFGPSGQQAFAQGADQGIEEITVTARRRDESLLDVPISITALSAE